MSQSSGISKVIYGNNLQVFVLLQQSEERSTNSSKTIDALMKLELPSGVEVEIKV